MTLREPPPDADVPCNGCTLCCRQELIWLHPEDGDPAQWVTEPAVHPLSGEVGRALAKKSGGAECVYLGDHGCTIHGRAPIICRAYDCGAAFAMLTRAERRRRVALGLADKAVFEQGGVRARPPGAARARTNPMTTRPDPALVEALIHAAVAYGRAWSDHNTHTGHGRATTKQSNALQAAHGALTKAARALSDAQVRCLGTHHLEG